MKLANLSSVLAVALAAATLSTPLAAQTPAPPAKAMEHHASSGWKEFDAFHEIMAATWHPAASNDLKPTRAKADSLLATAKKWAASAVPAACDTKPIRDAIADVVAGSVKVAELVAANASDADVRASLHEVHERFEVVEHGCHPPR